MSLLKKRTIIVFFLVLILLIGMGYFYLVNNDSFFDELSYDRQDREIIINQLLEKKPVSDEKAIKILREQGLKYPLNDLRRDLFKNRKRIPLKGVLGGIMNYTGEFVMQPNQEVLVKISDGHIDGKMLLRYEVKKGRISWKVLKVCSVP